MSATHAQNQVWLVRHGETEWSKLGKHTGRTDIPLLGEGREMAARLEAVLARQAFARVLSSPLSRARMTCELAGLGARAELRPELLEWDYGVYEGKTSAEIREDRPDWSLWRDGGPGGEAPGDIARRVDALLTELRGADGDVILFAHGHVLRVLVARWLGLGPEAGRFFMLGTATISKLTCDRGAPVVLLWNSDAHLA